MMAPANRRFSASIREAVEEQQKVNAALEDAAKARLPQAQGIAAELAKGGAATAANVDAATGLGVKLRQRFGFPQALTGAISAQAVGAGVDDVETAAQLARADGCKQQQASPTLRRPPYRLGRRRRSERGRS